MEFTHAIISRNIMAKPDALAISVLPILGIIKGKLKYEIAK